MQDYNNKPNLHVISHGSPHNQQGATLIVVLLVLILIVLAGVVAIKQSRTDLQLATSDQINTLLLQSSDSANNKLENLLNSQDQAGYQRAVSKSSIFGYYLSDLANTRVNEISYCFTPQTTYRVGLSSITVPSGGKVSSLGFCHTGNANSYSTGRDTVVTQVSIIPSPEADPETSEAFGNMPIGTDTAGLTTQRTPFDIRALSILPAYAKSQTSALDQCLSYSSVPGYTSQTRKECLDAQSVPAKEVYMQADVDTQIEAETCTKFGKGNGSVNCTLA